MENNKYEIEDFLTNKDFITWVKNPDGPQRVYWEAWIASNPEYTVKILRAHEIIKSMKVKSIDLEAKDYNDVFERLVTYKVNYSTKQIGYRHWGSSLGMIWRVAAILVIAFSLSFIAYTINTEKVQIVKEVININKSTNESQKIKLGLPDGSLVWLNTNSQLSYDLEYGKSNRNVHLKGEAYFEVQKNSKNPFVVKSEQVMVQAIGTSFNVNTLAKGIDVALLEGAVKVWIDNSMENNVVLHPGENAFVKDNGIELEISKFNTIEVTGWKDGILHFQNATFKDVINRLERWYNVQIEIVGVPQKNWNYTGTFIESSLERVLDRMSYTKGFSFSIENNFVEIKF